MQLQKLPFAQQMQFYEGSVRGVYLSIACDMEFLMSDIIAKIEKFPLVKGERLKFKEDKIYQLEMGKKTRRCIDDLKDYRKGVYYNKFKPQFDIIETLVHYRNLMAHGHSDYDDKKMDTSFIWFKNYKGKKIIEKIMVAPFILEMETYRKNLMKLLDLIIILTAERGNE